MTLNEWMTKDKVNSKEIAVAIGKSGSFVRELRRGARMPGLKTAEAIAVMSEGKVGMDEWPSSVPAPEASSPASPAQPAS